MLRPELADTISGISDVAGSGLRLVNREPGAEARSLLDRELDDAGIEASLLPGYHIHAAGDLDVAAAIAAGLADAGIASEPAALAHGLVFIPLAAERFDLVIPTGHVSMRRSNAIASRSLTRWPLQGFGAYQEDGGGAGGCSGGGHGAKLTVWETSARARAWRLRCRLRPRAPRLMPAGAVRAARVLAVAGMSAGCGIPGTRAGWPGLRWRG